jgi:guanylate kinase
LPPDERTLRRRLNGRATEPPGVLERRLAKAKEEILAAEASGAYTYRVVNDELGKAIEQVVAIVQERENR